MKTISFDGRIGASGAEVRTTQGGKPYVRFSVANNTFVNSQEKTEWFDVTSYDPFVIEKRINVLTKGTYVIIQGQLNTEVNVKDGKVWVNQYVTASTIDVPYFKKSENEQGVQEIKQAITPTDDGISTYTPETKPAPAKETKAKATKTVAESQEEDDNDLPF